MNTFTEYKPEEKKRKVKKVFLICNANIGIWMQEIFLMPNLATNEPVMHA